MSGFVICCVETGTLQCTIGNVSGCVVCCVETDTFQLEWSILFLRGNEACDARFLCATRYSLRPDHEKSIFMLQV